jgi:leucine dehydrogenase
VAFNVFEHPEFSRHENVVFCHEPDVGLSAIIAIHSTVLGPALGGCRMKAYASHTDALSDVLRLSKGMTYKNALAGLSFGGAKAVIIGDPFVDKTPAMMMAFGRFIERLSGSYISGEDVGISVADMEASRRVTRHVRGVAEGGAGDPSPATAHGVFSGIKAALLHRTGSSELHGRTVVVQGLGNVGMHLVAELTGAGATVHVADIRSERVLLAAEKFGGKPVDVAASHRIKADVFAPCALGAVLNAESIPQLGASIVAGAANNQLATPADGSILMERGILYCPDYVINAGGVISISHEGASFDRARMMRDVERIGDTLLDIFQRAEDDGLPVDVVADMKAERIIQESLRK